MPDSSVADLSWAAFDQARGTHPRQSAAQQANSHPVIPLSPAAQAQVKIIQKEAGLPQTGQLDPATVAFVNAHYATRNQFGKKTGGGGGGGGSKSGSSKKSGSGASSSSKSGSSSSSSKKSAAALSAAQEKAIQKRIDAAVKKAVDAATAHALQQEKRIAAERAAMHRSGKTVRVKGNGTPARRTAAQSKITRTKSGKGYVLPKGVGKVKAKGTANLANRHVAGTPYRYRHGWIPVTDASALKRGEPVRVNADDPVRYFVPALADSDHKVSQLAVKEGSAAGKKTTSKAWRVENAPGATDDQIGMDKEALSKIKAEADRRYEQRGAKIMQAAQLKATAWHGPEGYMSDETWDMEMNKHTAAKGFWGSYQIPNDYPGINAVLRDKNHPARKRFMKVIDTMFADVGVKTDKPCSVYRALRATDPESTAWLKSFKVGGVYEEDGMVSATAYQNFSQGWLKLNPAEGYAPTRTVNPNLDSVVEIELPVGTPIVGGASQFIEAMLHPDMKFRIKSIEQRTATPENPLGGEDEPITDPYVYRHVIVEVVK